MVDKKSKKPASNATKPDIKKGALKNKSNKEKNKNVTEKHPSDSAKKSIEIIKQSSTTPLYETDSGSEQEIPTTGEELLRWTKARMSFVSSKEEQGSWMALEEEQEIPVVPTSRKSIKSEKIEKMAKPKKKAGKKSRVSSSEKVTDEIVLDLTAPGPLEDEVLFKWRVKKEEQRQLLVKKEKSEVKFLEPTTEVEETSFSIDIKKDKKLLRKSLQAAKKEAQKLIEKEMEEQRKRELLFQKALMKRQQEEDEEIIRDQRNATSLRRIRRFEKERLDHVWELFRNSEVEHYRTCEKIPLVTKCDQLTSFVKNWEEEIGGMSVEELGTMCGINLELLNRLMELAFYTSEKDQDQMNQWKWAMSMLRSTQEEMISRAMYNVLSDINKNLKIDNLDFGEFQYGSSSFSLSIWLKLDWPVSLANPRKPPAPSTEVNLSVSDLICTFPQSIKCDQKALVCLYLPYDHVSDACETFFPPPKPHFLSKDLSESNYEDKLRKQKYAYESQLRSEYLDKVEKYKEKHPDRKYSTPFVLPDIPLNEDIPKVPVQNLDPTPTEYVDLADDILYESCIRNMSREAKPDEVNLREYQLIGGLYMIQLVYHPPQPQPLIKFHMTLRTVKPPKKLEEVPFYTEFHPPPLPWLDDEPRKSITSANTKSLKNIRSKRLTARYGSSKTDARKGGGGFDPEEVQRYKDALEMWELKVQQEKDKMMFISLGLPKGVIYLEKPNVCLWNEKNKSWSAKEIYEVDYEYTERRVTFRSSRLGLFGLSVKKYLNYPYKSWEIRPNVDDSISVILEGTKVTINLIVHESEITIKDFEYRISEYLVGKKGLNRLKSKRLSLPRFIEAMQSSGLDMFPDYDANCYYTATTEKHWGIAYVTYFAMAQSAIRYNYSSSKWNAETGRRSIVLRLREFDPNEDVSVLRHFELVQVTPLRCQLLECSEEDEHFSEEATILYKFQPNMQYLLKSMSKVTNRAKINEFSPITIYTLAEFLHRTRIFSFS